MKELDSEGRIISESAGGTDTAPKYTYQYDNSGRLTRITNPLGKATLISYAARRKTIIDAEQHSTIYEYDDLPGLPTRVIVAMGNQAVHSYDPLGRLITVNYNGVRVHVYNYDWLGNLISESHPETGMISYVYNNSLRLSQRIWGNSKQEYFYSSGRLSQISSYKDNSSSPDETIMYSYDLKGRVLSINSSKGWSRQNISYNIWGSITSETLSILGLADKTISYQYDGNNLLSAITYPSGRVATTSYNALNLPAFLSFNGKTIIDSITYGQNGLPTNISIAGNGTVYSANYLPAGYLASESLKKGVITLYDASYTYDGVGNITAIESTAPAPALNATFSYDALYRLTSATYSIGRVNNYTYQYDAYGNMLRVDENGVPVFEKAYDSHNRIIGFSYDDRGNLLYANGKYFNWDGFNRLSSILNTSGEVLGQYTYDDRGLRLKAIPPLPEINIRQNNIDIPDGGTVSFKIVSQEDKTFIVENAGLANLCLGNVTLSGPNADQFQVIQQPASIVSPGNSTSFVVRFSPTSSGLKIASLSLVSNDLDENPYEITLYGNYEAEINIVGIPNGGNYDFGTVTIGDSVRTSFTIQNLGTAPLHLNGTPPVSISGKNPGNFSVEMQPQTIIGPGQSSTFEVQFTSTGKKIYTADLYIANDDANENPYIIHLSGSGAIGPASVIKTSSQNGLAVTFPAGEEKLLANTFQTIAWKADKDVNFVRIEYSTDNGSTYRTIAERAPNTGKFDWLIPSDISPNYLIRISDADKHMPISDSISFEFSFKIKKSENFFESAPGFSSIITIPDLRRQAYLKLNLNIIPFEAKRLFQISANNVWAKAEGYDVFLDRWHRIKIDMDPDTSLASVWLDNEPLLEYVGLKLDPMIAAANLSGMIAFSHWGEGSSAIFIDDMEVKVLNSNTKIDYENTESTPLWKRLFIDDFENYQDEAEVYKAGGWTEILESSMQPIFLEDEAEQVQIYELIKSRQQAKSTRQLKISKNHIKLDDQDAFSGFRSLWFGSLKGERLS
ncbi:MAG: choice-of-anchor D domain-containing protein, partial [Candidatus Saccharicenans sp.]